MSSPYAGVNTFPEDVLLPDDGDPNAASTFNVPYEQLCDRTRYMKTHMLNGFIGGSYAPTNPIHIEGDGVELNATTLVLTDVVVTTDTSVSVTMQGNCIFTTGSGQLSFDTNATMTLGNTCTFTTAVGSGIFCNGAFVLGGPTNHYLLTARSAARSYQVSRIISGWDFNSVGECVQNTVGAFRCIIDLDLPNACAITDVRVFMFGAPGHGALLPATQPSVVVNKRHLVTGITTAIASATATAPDTANYEAGFWVDVTGMAEIVDRAGDFVYFATVTGESGANSLIGLRVQGARVTVNTAIVDEAT